MLPGAAPAAAQGGRLCGVSESEGVGSTVPTKIDTKSLTLPHELYASVSRRLSRRGRRLRTPRVAVAPPAGAPPGTRVRRALETGPARGRDRDRANRRGSTHCDRRRRDTDVCRRMHYTETRIHEATKYRGARPFAVSP